jgi:hypothetical protein
MTAGMVGNINELAVCRLLTVGCRLIHIRRQLIEFTAIQLPRDVNLQELGFHRLKVLIRPDPIFQVGDSTA